MKSKRPLQLAGAAAGVFFSAFSLAGAQAPGAPTPIAVIDFDYFDTSGEPTDQTGAHAALLKDFMERLRGDLEASGKYRVVALACPDAPCSAAANDPRALVAQAGKAGARLLLYGGVHKMSTLVQWAKVGLVDLETDRLIDDRWLSFRGDSPEAWRRAESFLARKLAEKTLKTGTERP